MRAACWFCAGFGTCLGLVIVMATFVDVWAIRCGHLTISEKVYLEATRRLWTAVLITAILSAPVFILIGHLFFPHVIHIEAEP